MKYNFKNLPIKQQLLILLGAFTIIAIASFFILRNAIENIETARLQEETAAKLNFESLNKAAGQASDIDQASMTPLRKVAQHNERIIKTFQNGGFLSDSSTYSNRLSGTESLRLQELNLLWDSVYYNINTIRFQKHSTDSVFQETVQVANNDSLNTFRSEVQNRTISINNPKVVMAKAFVQDNIQDLKILKNAFVDSLNQKLAEAKSTVNYTIFIVVLINLVALIGVLLMVHKIILTQLKSLEEAIGKIIDGQFDINITFDWKNEVNAIGQKINDLTAKLRNATKFVKEVEKGELDAKFEGIDEELLNKNSLEAALIDMRDQMQKVEKEEEIRKWSTEGLAKFVDILRTSNDDVNELSDKIISNLVEYTHSNQGGLYLLNDENDDEKYLELISLYAFNNKKFEEQKYKLGEGLVGQTFLERKTTYLLEIPNEYIKITSGLGEANPKAILVVPLQVNKEIFGIIELASFEEYKDYEIQFVEKLGESIASTIASVKNNQRTKKLLEESQELTEEMQAQEEEMRQNMEELSATQEEMARKEIEISAQINAINNTIGTVEYDSSGLITNTNSVFVKQMGYSSDELYDSYFKSLYRDEKDIWAQIKSGQSVEGVFLFKKANDNEIMLETSFTPVRNDEDEVYKIIQLVIGFGKQPSSEETDVNEVEFALRQNLEELEITQEQLNKQLKFAEEKLEFIESNVSYMTLKEDLSIFDVNNTFISNYGWSREDILGKPVSDILTDEAKKTIRENGSSFEARFKDLSGNEYIKLINIMYPDNEFSSEVKALLIWV